MRRSRSTAFAPVGEREHPRERTAAGRIEPRCGLPDLEVHVLRHLLGLRRVDHEPADEPEDPRGGRVVERGECLPVTGSDPGEQFVGCRRWCRRACPAAVDHESQHVRSCVAGREVDTAAACELEDMDHPNVKE